MFILYLSGFLFRRTWRQQCRWPKVCTRPTYGLKLRYQLFYGTISPTLGLCLFYWKSPHSSHHQTSTTHREYTLSPVNLICFSTGTESIVIEVYHNQSIDWIFNVTDSLLVGTSYCWWKPSIPGECIMCLSTPHPIPLVGTTQNAW